MMKYPETMLWRLHANPRKFQNVVRYRRSSTKRKTSMKLVKRHFRLIR